LLLDFMSRAANTSSSWPRASGARRWKPRPEPLLPPSPSRSPASR
jgi:hypothetical protein